MKNIIVLFTALLFINCFDETIANECFDNVNVSGTINLSLPIFVPILTAGNHVSTTIDGRSIIIINRGTSSSPYKAYDLECPENDCTSNMTFDGLKLICSCSDKEYNSLNGSPIDGDGCFALEYNVTETSTTLQISN